MKPNYKAIIDKAIGEKPSLAKRELTEEEKFAHFEKPSSIPRDYFTTGDAVNVKLDEKNKMI